MIRITDSLKCCGCSACVSSCPVRCIIWKRDEEGFDYPVVDECSCIACGRCEQVCPMNVEKQDFHGTAYAARFDEYAQESSSGGVFSAFAVKVLDEGGVVVGAAFDDNCEVVHLVISDKADLYKLRGSKYVQSKIDGAFIQTRKFLESGRKVLFSGTPCQISGLVRFLGKSYDGLFTVDIACHGVASPLVWHKYRQSVGAVGVNFRDKSGLATWRRYNVSYYRKKDILTVSHDRDPYMQLYLQNINIRPSCYNCKFRAGAHSSDVTLADFWNVGRVYPEMDDGNGVSALIVNSSKGQEMLNEFITDSDKVSIRKISYEHAVSDNGGFNCCIDKPAARSDFFSGYSNTSDLINYIKGFVKLKPYLKDMYDRLHSYMASIKRRMQL